ncbi:MAG: peptidase U32 [Desulfobacterium sp.]|nr:peptidase U32 [Desulfobacterium sp.]
MPDQPVSNFKPEILAPAGNRDSFLAAIAAGADAIYCGLKDFSARMAADNFTIDELARLAVLAREKGVRVYITLNTLVKPDELDQTGKLLDQLNRWVKPDAIILQDLSFIPIARQVGFQGELHLSTLANVSFPSALQTIKNIRDIHRVVIPRELNVDEIRSFAAACPQGIHLEVFIHGALCYGVSGRCYWSSYMGGKSGLRGRCVQPCRRVYTLKGQKKRFFSCNDLSLDVLAKLLLPEKNISAWKIEGRKKGPHYVYNTVSAYRLLRDHVGEPAMKKEALFLLESAFGRKGSHYNFLPQRPQIPISTDTQTGSGLLIGTIKGSAKEPYLIPREQLLAGDLIRIGYEDEPGHYIYRVTKSVPKKGRLTLCKVSLKPGTSAFLLDRREQELAEFLKTLNHELEKVPEKFCPSSQFMATYQRKQKEGGKDKKTGVIEMHVERLVRKGRKHPSDGFWLSPESINNLSKQAISSSWCWFPPVIWPEDEPEIQRLIQQVLRNGCKRFVLNAPWQICYFQNSKKLTIWAGPFCNAANPLVIQVLADMGFSGVIVTSELGQTDYLSLSRQSVLPLGIVISGNWPLCISRTLSQDMLTNQKMTSPKNEDAWVAKYDSLYWLFPNWKLDLLHHKEMLQKAGFSLLVHLNEPIPKDIQIKKRPGLWNWQLNLL